jgi:hypothetical protein
MLDGVAAEQFVRRAGGADGSRLEQVGPVDDLEHLLHVLLDDQHGESARTDALHQLEDLLHHDRRQTGRRLVEQQQLGIAHQRTTDGAHLLLAARHGAGHLMATLLHAREQVEHELQALRELGPRLRHEGAHPEIVFHGEPREKPSILRHVRDAEADDPVGRRGQHVGAFHRDTAARRADQARDHAHQGRLACAVGADHADRLARLDVEADVEQRLECAVAGIDGLQIQHDAHRRASAAAACVASASVPR